MQVLSAFFLISGYLHPGKFTSNFMIFSEFINKYFSLVHNCFRHMLSVFLQVKEEAQQLALLFENVGAFKVKRKGGKGKQIFGR